MTTTTEYQPRHAATWSNPTWTIKKYLARMEAERVTGFDKTRRTW